MPRLVDQPSLAKLERLATSADIQDRAFAASALLLQLGAENSEQLAPLYQRIRATAGAQHAEVRARIRDGALDRRAFVAMLQAVPLELRDHLLEEILDIAYPPLQRLTLPRDAVTYSPSGLTEILFVADASKLGPGKTFVDLGSGLGKVASLVSLLTGADAYGIELDPNLVAGAQAAAQALGLDRVRFVEGDIQTAPLPPADVYFMFIPTLRSLDVAARLEPLARRRPLLLFSQALELERLPWLRSAHQASYWLEMYESAPAGN